MRDARRIFIRHLFVILLRANWLFNLYCFGIEHRYDHKIKLSLNLTVHRSSVIDHLLVRILWVLCTESILDIKSFC